MEKEYYVPAGLTPTVKVGDHLEAGDVVSDGVSSPADIIKHKGIGEGRKYFVDTMKKTFDDAGMRVNRRNFELIAKAAVDHVRINSNEGVGGYLPDQVVSYQAIERDYKPRPDAKLVRVDSAVGKYLEEPVLHYTIGTRVTGKIKAFLEKHGVQSVHVHDHPPFFVPEMVRLLDVPLHEHDWMHQLNSTNLERRLIQAVNTGMTSSLTGPSPVAGISYGVGFPKGESHKHAEAQDLERLYSEESDVD